MSFVATLKILRWSSSPALVACLCLQGPPPLVTLCGFYFLFHPFYPFLSFEGVDWRIP